MDSNTTVFIAVAFGGLIAVMAYLLSSGNKGKAKANKFLQDPTVKYRVKLVEKLEITHDTRRFRFALPSDEHVLGLPTGNHVYLSTSVNGELCSRPYTPVSSDDDFGYVDFVVKVYFANVHPKFPEGGKMTQYLESLSIGDHIDIRGPLGKFEYRGRGVCAIRQSRQDPPDVFTVRRLGMIAGGSGITPILQVLKHALKDEKDQTEMWVIFANQSEKDILLREDLDSIAEKYPSRVHIWYTVDRAEPNWRYSVGFVDANMVREHMPQPGDDTLILACGPPPMIKFACEPSLDALKYPAERRFYF